MFRCSVRDDAVREGGGGRDDQIEAGEVPRFHNLWKVTEVEVVIVAMGERIEICPFLKSAKANPLP